MAEQSHREEMSAAIRAQRERQAVPRSIAGEPEPAGPAAAEPAPPLQPEPEPARGFLRRLRGR